MDPKNTHAQHDWHQTRMAYIWSHLLNAPFWAIYNMLPFILYKDLHATSWQIGAMITLKPVVSLFSMYWSSLVIRRPDRLLPQPLLGQDSWLLALLLPPLGRQYLADYRLFRTVYYDGARRRPSLDGDPETECS